MRKSMEKHFPHQVFNRDILFSRQTSPTRHHPRPSRRAPCQGGLQEDDFDELFRALGLEGDDEQRQRERERESGAVAEERIGAHDH